MKVILLKDVPRVGRKFEVKDVPDGHALNFLIPRKLAERATADAIARINKLEAAAAAGKAESNARFSEMVEKIKESGLMLKGEANEQGVLFRALHASDVQEALEKLGYKIEEEQIIIEEPLKSLGTHPITLASSGVESSITVTIEAA